jgi:type II secretory ATPase GspE/PulE/Tfp pilus assembly ATPase PilB-like protein
LSSPAIRASNGLVKTQNTSPSTIHSYESVDNADTRTTGSTEKMMTITLIKADARRLAAHLRAVYGWNLKTAGSLEALAASRGHKDWNTYAAALRAGAGPAALISLAAPTGRPTATDGSLANLLNAALDSRATVIRIHLRADAPSAVDFCIDGQNVRYATLLPAEATALRAYLGLPECISNAEDGPVEHTYCGRNEVFRWQTRPLPPTKSGEAVLALSPPASRADPYCDMALSPEWAAAALGGRPGLYLVAGTSGSGSDILLRQLVRQGKRAGLSIGALSAQGSDTFSSGTGQFSYDNCEPSTTFAACVNQMARSNHDILICDEVRDKAAAAAVLLAVQAGLTVVVALHASSVRGAVLRLANMACVAERDLAHVLRGVRLQTLLPKTCLPCHGEGCTRCGQRGFFGQVAVAETVLLNGEHPRTSLLANTPWWPTLAQEATRLAAEGKVSPSVINSRFQA